MLDLVIRSLAVMALVAVLGGCNTVRGLGKDVQNAGEAVEDAAEEMSK